MLVTRRKRFTPVRACAQLVTDCNVCRCGGQEYKGPVAHNTLKASQIIFRPWFQGIDTGSLAAGVGQAEDGGPC